MRENISPEVQNRAVEAEELFKTEIEAFSKILTKLDDKVKENADTIKLSSSNEEEAKSPNAGEDVKPVWNVKNLFIAEQVTDLQESEEEENESDEQEELFGSSQGDKQPKVDERFTTQLEKLHAHVRNLKPESNILDHFLIVGVPQSHIDELVKFN